MDQLRVPILAAERVADLRREAAAARLSRTSDRPPRGRPAGARERLVVTWLAALRSIVEARAW